MQESKSMRKRLAEWSKTPEGRESYEKVADEMRKQIKDGEELEEEIHKYNKERFDEYFPEQDGDFISEVDFMTCLGRVARHFAKWGYLRAAEKYNEIEYNRQRAEESVPNDLEEAAEISFDEAYALTEDYRDFLAKGLTEKQPRPIGPHWFCEYAKNRFIAGAKWDREKMMSEAVEGTVMDFSSNQPRPQVDVYVDSNKYHTGDKVRVIVIPNTDEK